MSFDRLIARIDELKNPSVAGLDPKLEYVPRFLKDAFFVKDGYLESRCRSDSGI